MTVPEHASNDLVTEHLALVGYQVSALAARLPSHIHRDDLVSAGHLALVRAARSYNASTGVPFGRWAALRIRGALIDELRAMDWATRQARQKATRVATVTNELASTLGHTPSILEVAAHTGMTPEEVDSARAVSDVRILSMDAGPEESSLADSVPDDDLGPEGRLLAAEREGYLRAAVAALPEKMRQVIEGTFFEGRTAAQVAADIGVTQSRVSQLRTEAMALMRDGINAHLDPDLVATSDRPDGVVERRRQAYYARVAAEAAGSAAAALPSQRRADGGRLVVA